MGLIKRLYRRADVLYGRCESVPAVVEAVQFHGIKSTKNDALVKEVAHLYKCVDFPSLLRDVHLVSKHLVEVGLMESATPLIDICEGNAHSYVVNFIVKEPKSFTVGAKAGVSTYGEADGILNANKSSVFGRGEAFRAAYTYTVKGNQTFDFSFSKPFLGKQRYSSVSFSVYRNLTTLPWNLSETSETGVLMQYNNLINKKVQLLTIIDFVWRKFMPLKEAVFNVREFAGHSLKFSMENAVNYDTRDHKILPSKGLSCRFSQELAGLIGDACFAKQLVEIQAATPLFLGAFVCGTFQGSVLTSFSEHPVHVLDRIYLGGPFDLRGFGLKSLGTRVSNASLGGIASCAGVFHIYRPLVPSDMLFAHAFIGVGSVLPSNSFDKVRDFLDERRVSAGVGVTFVFRDLVRLELNYALPLRYRSTDCCNPGFQFGAGISFL